MGNYKTCTNIYKEKKTRIERTKGTTKENNDKKIIRRIKQTMTKTLKPKK